MNQDKIQAFNDQQKLIADENSKTEDMAFAVHSILNSQQSIELAVKKSILQLIQFIQSNQPQVSVTNQKDFPSYDAVVSAIRDVVAEVKNSNKSLDAVEQKEADYSLILAGLDKVATLISKLPTELPDAVETVSISNQLDYNAKFDEVTKAVTNLPAPIINIPETKIPNNVKELEKLLKAVENIKFPEVPKTDLGPLLAATKKVSDTIAGLTFPVPNYILPFKDINGKATQVQLDASGNVPTSGGGGGGGLTDAQLRATPVPVTGTVTTTGLTDTQLRATPVPVSGTVSTGGLTDAQLRATAVPVSGTVTMSNPTAQGLTDTQLRATPVPISGTVSTGLTQTTPLTDTQLRASAVPISLAVAPTTPVTGTFFQATQPVSATALPLPAGAATSTNLSDGSQKGQIVDSTGNGVTVTGNRLDVNATISTAGLATTALQTALINKIPDQEGTWGYNSGTSGTLNLTGGKRVLSISAVAQETAASFTINGGDSITLPYGSTDKASSAITIEPKANLTDPTIVFTATKSYYVEYVV